MVEHPSSIRKRLRGRKHRAGSKPAASGYPGVSRPGPRPWTSRTALPKAPRTLEVRPARVGGQQGLRPAEARSPRCREPAWEGKAAALPLPLCRSPSPGPAWSRHLHRSASVCVCVCACVRVCVGGVAGRGSRCSSLEKAEGVSARWQRAVLEGGVRAFVRQQASRCWRTCRQMQSG